MKTIREYTLETFEKSEIEDITKHGMVSGFGPLIYYHDTVKFHDEYESEIWDMLHNDATDQDITICELIAQFNGQSNVGSMHQFKNMLCWYAIERTCCELINEWELEGSE